MKYKVSLNGKIYEVEVEKGTAMLLDEYDAIAAPVAAAVAQVAPAAAPTTTAPAVSGNAVPSPLPGVVVAVKVTVGQKVKVGEVLAIIEAMKMENEVTATKDGLVTKICVQKGSQVVVGTALFEMA